MSLANWKQCRAFLVEEARTRGNKPAAKVSAKHWKPLLEKVLRETMRAAIIGVQSAGTVLYPFGRHK